MYHLFPGWFDRSLIVFRAQVLVPAASRISTLRLWDMIVHGGSRAHQRMPMVSTRQTSARKLLNAPSAALPLAKSGIAGIPRTTVRTSPMIARTSDLDTLPPQKGLH